MTKEQAHWAKRHGWFCQAFELTTGDWWVEVQSMERDIYTDGTASPWRAVRADFNDYEQLRAFAGY